MELKERLNLFKEELNLINKKDIREFVKACISASPDYIFEDCPSSSSGKFHPIDELGGDGTVLHTRKVFAVAYELSRALGCEHHRDEVCAAALLHDMAKQTLEKTGHTAKDHPQIMAKLVAAIYNNDFKGKLSKESANMIYYAVFHHYGPWTEASVKKNLKKYTQEELTVYLSDYISSKRFVKVDYIRRDGLGFNVIENKSRGKI